jgi:hypothetical protein
MLLAEYTAPPLATAVFARNRPPYMVTFMAGAPAAVDTSMTAPPCSAVLLSMALSSSTWLSEPSGNTSAFSLCTSAQRERERHQSGTAHTTLARALHRNIVVVVAENQQRAAILGRVSAQGAAQHVDAAAHREQRAAADCVCCAREGDAGVAEKNVGVECVEGPALTEDGALALRAVDGQAGRRAQRRRPWGRVVGQRARQQDRHRIHKVDRARAAVVVCMRAHHRDVRQGGPARRAHKTLMAVPTGANRRGAT